MLELSREQFKAGNQDNVVMPSCSNCEFNMGCVCGDGENSLHNYGDKIEDDTLVCEHWGISIISFIEQEQMNGR